MDAETPALKAAQNRVKRLLVSLEKAEARAASAEARARQAEDRAPTAAEWERAASNGGTTEYPWGNAEPDGTRANFCDVNCTHDWKTASVNDGYEKTSLVCSFPAGRNRDGVCDLSGNAYEWTATDYDSSNKEIRGGSWYNSPRYLRAGYRFRNCRAGATITTVFAAPSRVLVYFLSPDLLYSES